MRYGRNYIIISPDNNLEKKTNFLISPWLFFGLTLSLLSGNLNEMLVLRRNYVVKVLRKSSKNAAKKYEIQNIKTWVDK